MTISIAILTGRRLPLLKKTVSSLRAATAGLLDTAYVAVYLNGQDAETDAYVRTLPFVDDYLYIPSESPEPIGPATSRLATQVLGKSQYHLHLEDDWVCSTSDPDFVRKAQAILDARPEVGQVRLRNRREAVMKAHMVTGTPFAWERGKDGVLVSRLHFTFNPSLVRMVDLRSIYPAESEVDAAKNYAKRFSHVAQLDPGVFLHGGGQDSLRQRMGRE